MNFANLESWDYLCFVVIGISLVLLAGGIKRLKAANPQYVDERALKLRAYGAMIVALAYLVCKKYV
ncbi:MAG: hypothetical protein SO119_08445 [Phascolarctobacterium sp.]|nr:hypothetical protein [Phascolarctobacterium sp.]